jgi:hypothetical protein
MNIHDWSGRSRISEPGGGLFDFVAENGGFFEILVFDGLAEFLLEHFEAIGKVARLAEGFGDFADMADAFVHGLEEAFEVR